ncbi:MAG: hypothetical protein Q7S74_01495 [Nanoarchaeota archaeon]|nr:hypothetical protein [Nanoarchaeota archaeon]
MSIETATLIHNIERNYFSLTRSQVDNAIDRLKTTVEKARYSGLDLSLEYNDEKYNEEYCLQEELRLASRSLCTSYEECGNSEEVLNTLQEVRDLFGKHPFHHVIEGRIIHVVHETVSAGVVVPSQFRRYETANIEPYQNPHLNYNTPRDIPKEHSEHIPPDWSA